MKSAKQNYITIGSDGTVLPQGKPRKAAEPIGESADVAYRLARMAEEAAASLPIAPNAHDAADAADYTAVPRALATAAPRTRVSPPAQCTRRIIGAIATSSSPKAR